MEVEEETQHTLPKGQVRGRAVAAAGEGNMEETRKPSTTVPPQEERMEVVAETPTGEEESATTAAPMLEEPHEMERLAKPEGEKTIALPCPTDYCKQI